MPREPFLDRLQHILSVITLLPLFFLLIQLCALHQQIKKLYYIIFGISYIKLDGKFHQVIEKNE